MVEVLIPEIHFDTSTTVTAVDNMPIVAVEQYVVTSGGSTDQVTVSDVLYDRVTSAIVRTDLEIFADATGYESKDEAIATVSSAGYVQSVSNGIVGIYVRGKSCDKLIQFTANTGGSAPVLTYNSYITGSLGKHIKDAMASLVSAGGSQARYSTKDYTTLTFVRNPTCWLAAYDWTGVTVAQSNSRYYHHTAITPVHVASATHVGLNVGAVLHWLDSDNTIITRSVTGIVSIGLDLRIAKLNAPLPSTVIIYKIVPTTFRNYLFTVDHIPIVIFDQDEDANQENYTNDHPTAEWMYFEPASDLSTTIRPGDSSSPLFIIISGEPILMGSVSSSIASTRLHAYNAEIEAAIVSLGSGGYSVQYPDLSSFTDFS